MVKAAEPSIKYKRRRGEGEEEELKTEESGLVTIS